MLSSVLKLDIHVLQISHLYLKHFKFSTCWILFWLVQWRSWFVFCVWQIDQQIEDMFASVKRVTDIAKPQVISNPMAGIGALPTGQSNQQKLALAKQLAAKINMAKKIGPDARDITQQAAKFILSDEGFAPKVAVSFLCYWYIYLNILNVQWFCMDMYVLGIKIIQ